jgi:hypothetical protein
MNTAQIIEFVWECADDGKLEELRDALEMVEQELEDRQNEDED